jgi:DNA repair ATPase RecN
LPEQIDQTEPLKDNTIETLLTTQNQLIQQIANMQQIHYQQLEQLLIGSINQQQLLGSVGQVINLMSQAINEIQQKTNRLINVLSDTQINVHEVIADLNDIRNDLNNLPSEFQDIKMAINNIKIYRDPNY